MAYSHCTGTVLGQVQGTEPGGMGPNVLYRNVHTGLRLGEVPDPLFPVVLVQFPEPVPLPVPCSVNQP